MARAEEKVSFGGRLKQIGMVFSFTAKQDKMFIPLAVGAVLIPLLLAALAVVLGWGLIFIPLGILVALLALLIVLNLRSNRAMMNAAEGQPGAAASIIENMRGDWRVRPAVSSTTAMDMVHLVVGKPGVILLAEGNPQRVRSLLGQEKRRIAKVIGSAPLHDYVIGNGENEIPIRKLRMTLTKLPRALNGKDVNSLDKRLTALSSARPQIPKGAIPKNMRPPKGAFRQTRGR
ncbi:DUF4191 domain-containing protein [Asanoa sp. WMMD1127]|uniref:DUF4191 domain-containing protein n=1 Tax=Asanoa sp. WMMD1127 TaxID=3016107 RepID=UPI002416AC6A|nr:DUF4191 domain-containing protein [Asanoa sp. WMMD1127]MDG4827226.1 DUF4191 domain-containing protein [Asanoa sp. WMMD1127]